VNAPRIENSERGITLNKSLAWTIVSALVGAGIWVGMQVSSTRTELTLLTKRAEEDRAKIDSAQAAIASLQTFSARVDQRLIGIETTVHRTEQQTIEILRELRGMRQP
jgi:enoyl-[acyl-carrier-protein] reductase (NADH)